MCKHKYTGDDGQEITAIESSLYQDRDSQGKFITKIDYNFCILCGEKFTATN